MIEQFAMPDGNGSIVMAPMCQLQLNELQIAVLIGADCPDDVDRYKIETPDPRVKSTYWGKLSTINFILKQQILNSLFLQDWDFETYPDPELIFLDLPREEVAP